MLFPFLISALLNPAIASDDRGMTFLAGQGDQPGGEIAPTPACVVAKKTCDLDDECRTASSYVHSTCVTGTCDHHCTTAVLKLYHLAKGKELLISDLSCVQGIAKEIRKCFLYPVGSTLYCTLSRLICEEDPVCDRKLDIYSSGCDEALKKGACNDECGERLANVYSHPDIGPKMMNCTCRSSDELCKEERRSVFDVCQRLAESIVAGRTSGGDVRSKVNFAMYLVFSLVLERNIGVINGAPTGMGLLTPNGHHSWHPGLAEVKRLCENARKLADDKGVSIARLAVEHSLDLPGHSLLTGANKLFGNRRHHWEGVEIANMKNLNYNK